VAQTDFVSRGQELVTAGQYQEAVKVCRLGLLARPGEVNGRLVLASALLALRRYDEVLAEMRVAIELEPGNAGAHQLRGEALLRKGDPHGAVDALARAKKLAGSDPAIAGLLEEAKLAQAAAGPPAFVDGDSMTKHYPSHRGGDASGSGRSGSFTKPIDRRRAPAEDRTPSPDTLRVGDKSGTVELDPELEGVELEDDELADPPSSVSTVEVSDDDLEEVDEDDDDARAPEAQTRAGRPGRTPTPAARGEREPAARPVDRSWRADENSESATKKHALPVPPRDEDAAPTVPRPLIDDEHPPRAPVDRARPAPRAPLEMFEEESSLAGRTSHPRLAELPAGPLGALTPAPVMTPSGRFLSTPSGPGAVVGGAAPAHAPTVAGAMPPPAGTPPGMAPPSGRLVPAAAPQAKTMVPATMAAVRPTVAMSAAAAPATGGPPGADMDVIRAGLGADYGATPLPPPMATVAPGPGPSPRTSRMSLRSPVMIAVWVTITLAIIGGGVFAGFKIREVRLAKQISSAKKAADGVARTDTWAGWRNARDRLAAISRARASGGNRAALAKARAILAARYDDDLEGARAAVAEVAKEASEDAALARAYLAIADGDGAAARTAITDAGGADADPELALAAAYVGALEARWDAAASAARRATEQDPRPAAFALLCAIETARQRFPDAERACAEAERLVPGHPAAIIARARQRAASGAARAEADKLRGELEALNAEAARPVADQRLGVSPGQAAWAQLALAEVGLAAGEPQKARVAIERLKGSQRSSRGLLEAQAALGLALGDVGEAGRLAEQGLERWPTSPIFTAVRARALLSTGDLEGAAAVIGKLAAADDSIELTILRGEIAIAKHDLPGATKLLDAALAKRPDDLDALLARAAVDLENNDPHAAQTRLEARYSKQAPPRLTIAYASALRLQKQWQDARVALGRITTDGAPGPITGRAWLERARVERDAGNAKDARDAYGRAQEMLPSSREAQREAAVLAIDDGDALGGKDALKKLLASGPDDGAALVEAARALTFTGDLAGAKAHLDRAADLDATPAARLARERGRLALRHRDTKGALAALEQSIAADERDFEAWLLLLDAELVAGDTAEAKRVNDEILRKFPDRRDSGLVTGRLALISGRTNDALTDFKSAKTALVNAPRRALADACFWVGYSFYAQGDFANAMLQLAEATKHEATNADAYGILGQIYVETQDWVNAATTLARAVELDPENPDAWFALGVARQNLRRPKDARTAFERYLASWPQGDRAAEARQFLGR